jgi:hypothetical protein
MMQDNLRADKRAGIGASLESLLTMRRPMGRQASKWRDEIVCACSGQFAMRIAL